MCEADKVISQCYDTGQLRIISLTHVYTTEIRIQRKKYIEKSLGDRDSVF